MLLVYHPRIPKIEQPPPGPDKPAEEEKQQQPPTTTITSQETPPTQTPTIKMAEEPTPTPNPNPESQPEAKEAFPPPSLEPIPIPTPIITTPRFMIRAYHKTDIEPMVKILNSYNIARHMPNTFPHPYTLSDAEFWVDLVTRPDTPHKSFGIFIPDPSSSSSSSSSSPSLATPNPIPSESLNSPEEPKIQQKYKLAGSIGLQPHTDVESKTWNLGYLMGEAYQTQGIMTEAATLFTRWAFETFPEEDLIRLEGGVFGGNTPSMKVMNKIGFKFEGIRRKAIWKNGKNLDLHVYGLLREDLFL